jgi:hypothetical protein
MLHEISYIFTIAWLILGLRMENTVSGYGGEPQMC